MKNQFAKIVAVLMVLAMAVSVFSICAFAADTTETNVVLLGDVNLDGRVTIQDATALQKALAKISTLDEVQEAAADADENDSVNIKDATAIQKWIAKYADANQNIGQPLVSTPDQTPDESTPDQTPDESTPDQTPDEATKDETEATEDEKPATDDQTATEDEKPATDDQPATEPSEPATDDQPATEPKFYTVAGEAGLCGFGWDPAQNVMTDDGDGTWSITFTGIAAGTYQFKVVENGAWGNPDYNLEGVANSSGNASVTVPVDNATVIIGFDGEKAVIEFVTAPEVDDEPATKDEEPATKDEEPATKDEEPATKDEAVVSYYLVGWINGADVYDTTYAIVDGTITVEFNDASYVAVQDSNGTIYWTNGWLGENPTSATLGEFGSENNKFHVAAGTATLTWDAATCTIALA